jgi:hypothetical protein
MLSKDKIELIVCIPDILEIDKNYHSSNSFFFQKDSCG